MKKIKFCKQRQFLQKNEILIKKMEFLQKNQILIKK